MAVKSKCQAKDPANCPYHGAKAYQEAFTILINASDQKRDAKTFKEMEEATDALQEALVNIDSTERGFKTLKREYENALAGQNAGSVYQLAKRLNDATENRARLANLEEVDTLPMSDNRRIIRDYIGKVLGTTEATFASSYDSLNVDQYYVADNPANRHIIPDTGTALKAAVQNTRGEADGGVRTVTINNKNSEKVDDLEVKAPKDGRPLIIHVFAGMPRIKVKSGTVIVLANSRSGHSIEVFDGAEAVVLGGLRSKISTETHKHGRTTIMPGEEGWGLQTGSGRIDIAPTIFRHQYSDNNKR